MKGVIKTFLPEKKYGFIKGDDGKDYFFHQDAFRDKSQIEKICEEAFVEFEQKATPKGYKAEKCSLINPSDVLTYIVPDEFLTSRSGTIKGWDIIERGEWIVHGSSRHSPDAAKKDLVNSAIRVGANSAVDLEYYKTTGSEAGTGRGTHHFTIHNFRARVVTIAKRNSKGQYKAEELLGLNQRAEALKRKLAEKTNRSKNKRNIVWLLVLGLSVFLWVGAQVDAIVPIIVLFVLGFIFGRSTNYDYWLERA